MNRNFCRVDGEGNITAYAPDAISLDGRMIYHAPDEDYAAWAASQVPPFLRLVSEPPTEVGCTFTSTERGEERDGKVYRLYDRHPIPAPEPPVIRYSKLKLITAAKRIGKWDALKAWIDAAGIMDEWLVCQYLASNYEGFDEIKAAVVAAGVATAEEVDAILAESVDEEVAA